MSRRVVAPLIAGLMVAASMPPWGWWPLGLVGVASYVSMTVVRRGDKGFLSAFMFGVGWFAPSLVWVWHLTVPGYFIVVLLFAAMHGIAGACARLLARDERSHRSALVVCHSLVEALRMSWPFGGVPIATMAIGQAGGPFLRLAPWFGVIGTGTVIWWVLADARRVRAAAAVLVLFVAASTWDGTSDTGRSVDLALVQGGGPQGTHAVRGDVHDAWRAHLSATKRLQPDPKRTAVVWPENVINIPGREVFAESIEHDLVAEQARRLGVPFVVGITETGGPGRFRNATVVIEPDGTISSRYDKKRAVPFGEYMPARDVLSAMGAPTDLVPLDAVRGEDDSFVDIAGTRAAVPVSWEVFFGGRVNEGVEAGGGYVINQTNGSSYTGTNLQSQQIASSRLRAREQGRWVAQVAPTGFSAFIAPSGRVHQRTGLTETAVIERSITVRTGRTPYSRLGNAPYIGVLLLAFAALSRRRSRAFPQAAS